MAFPDIFKNLISPITGMVNKYQEGKQAEKSATAKLNMAKQSNDYNLSLTDKEWEVISKRNEGDTWKDEYIVIVITSPLILLFLSAMLSAYTGDPIYLSSVKEGIASMKGLLAEDSTYSELLYIVVLAAIGIKTVKKGLR